MKFATIEKAFLIIFALTTVCAVVLVLPVLLSKWNLEQRIFEIGTQINEINSSLEELEKLLHQSDDPQEKQELMQQIDDLRREKSDLREESDSLNEGLEVLDNELKGRQFIGLILLLSNFAIAATVAIFGSLRIRDEEEEKLFK